MRKPSAPAISRLLKKAGYGVVATRLREGLLVTSDLWGATVTAQFDSDQTAIRRIKDVADYLGEQGFKVRVSGVFVRVFKPAS
jgi:hypothetical protein